MNYNNNPSFIVSNEILTQNGYFNQGDISYKIAGNLINNHFKTKEQVEGFIKNKMDFLCDAGLISFNGFYYYVNRQENYIVSITNETRFSCEKGGTMNKKQEEQFNKEVKKTLEDVRFQGLKAGAAGILGAVLGMCNEGKTVEDIKDFCEKSLNLDGMKEGFKHE